VSGLTKAEFEELWTQLDADALEEKYSQGAFLRLTEYFGHLDEDDKRVVGEVLFSWILDGNARQRFDALAIIEDFEIRSALPVLRENLTRLEDATGPSVPDDREQLEQIIAHLE
jgi:hypothetical protein